MTHYDWIVVGAGVTGAALAYELAQQHCSVLLVERHRSAQGATRYSYGGIAYWSGTTPLMQQLCAAGKTIHHSLSEELGASTQFRELDLVLTVEPTADPQAVAATYNEFAIPPQLISVEEACQLEPLLNPDAIAGALTVKHGHVNPEALTAAYLHAFDRLGGEYAIAEVHALQRTNDRVTGVVTNTQTYSGANVVICAGALSRALLQQSQITVHQYFTHAELIESPPIDVTLRTLVMPAVNQRFTMEAQASTAALDPLWDEPGHEPVPPILDAGAIQFQDGRLRLGQVSRVLTDPNAPIDAATSEQALRTAVGTVLPAFKDVPGTWQHCLIAFSRDRLPLVGAVPGVEGLQLFSGFSNPLALVPAVARCFAAQAANPAEQNLLAAFSPARFIDT